MLKIVALCVVCALLCFYLKNTNNDFYPVALLASSILVFYQISCYLYQTITIIQEIISLSNLDNEILKIIFKITGIGIIVDFGTGLINDLELKSLSDKLVVCGKILIFLSSIPIFYAVLGIVKNLLEL